MELLLWITGIAFVTWIVSFRQQFYVEKGISIKIPFQAAIQNRLPLLHTKLI